MAPVLYIRYQARLSPTSEYCFSEAVLFGLTAAVAAKALTAVKRMVLGPCFLLTLGTRGPSLLSAEAKGSSTTGITGKTVHVPLSG